jgi:plasmid maintenance system antidote protein VapI
MERTLNNDVSEQNVDPYNPGRLLDALAERLGAKNDAALSRSLEVAPPVLSKIRHGRLPVGATILLRMHEASGIGIRELRDLMGDRRSRMRMSPQEFRPKDAEGGEQQPAR